MRDEAFLWREDPKSAGRSGFESNPVGSRCEYDTTKDFLHWMWQMRTQYWGYRGLLPLLPHFCRLSVGYPESLPTIIRRRVGCAYHLSICRYRGSIFLRCTIDILLRNSTWYKSFLPHRAYRVQSAYRKSLQRFILMRAKPSKKRLSPERQPLIVH